MLKKSVKHLAVLLLLLTACAPGAEPPDERLTLVVSTTILGDLVHRIAGDTADVEVLMPIGADPHDFRLSSAQVASLSSADLVVLNGLGLEEGILDVIEGVEAEVLEVGPLVDPLLFGDGSSFDPHVWLDPIRMSVAADEIGSRLAEIDDKVDWRARASVVSDSLVSLDGDLEQIMGDLPTRKLVTNHDSLGYLADRYDLEVVGVVIPGGSSLGNPSSAELSDLVGTMEAEGVTVVFADTSNASALAEAIAGEVDGGQVIELFTGSLGGPGSGAETYEAMMRTNSRLIAEALG